MFMRIIRFAVVFAVAAVFGWAQSDSRIVPLYAVAPSVFQTGLTSSVLFTVLQANPNSNQQIQNGDTFTFALSVAGASVVSLGTITVNAAGFGPSNFTASLSADTKQITLTYTGAATRFGPGESFSVLANLVLTQVTS